MVRQESTGQNSVTLLWQEPDQPNGIILEYEIKYYEKVMQSSLPQTGPSTAGAWLGVSPPSAIAAISQPCTGTLLEAFVDAVLIQPGF